MTVKEIAHLLGFKIYCGSAGLENEIKGGYTSDLLSDVVGHAKEGDIWITLHTHKNITAVASLKKLSAIVLVKGYSPDEDTAEASEVEGIPILGTSMQSFEISGAIYEQLKA